nr:MAG TPA: hypothetical protein [Caudoviricetes sp.]
MKKASVRKIIGIWCLLFMATTERKCSGPSLHHQAMLRGRK